MNLPPGLYKEKKYDGHEKAFKTSAIEDNTAITSVNSCYSEKDLSRNTKNNCLTPEKSNDIEILHSVSSCVSADPRVSASRLSSEVDDLKLA